jgi:hypothetical protein
MFERTLLPESNSLCFYNCENQALKILRSTPKNKVESDLRIIAAAIKEPEQLRM